MSDINQPSLPTPFDSVLVFISVFMAFSTVFHSINSPNNSAFSHSVLPVLFQSYWFFQLLISLWQSLSSGWLGSKHQLTNFCLSCQPLYHIPTVSLPFRHLFLLPLRGLWQWADVYSCLLRSVTTVQRASAGDKNKFHWNEVLGCFTHQWFPGSSLRQAALRRLRRLTPRSDTVKPIIHGWNVRREYISHKWKMMMSNGWKLLKWIIKLTATNKTGSFDWMFGYIHISLRMSLWWSENVALLSE